MENYIIVEEKYSIRISEKYFDSMLTLSIIKIKLLPTL